MKLNKPYDTQSRTELKTNLSQQSKYTASEDSCNSSRNCILSYYPNNHRHFYLLFYVVTLITFTLIGISVLSNDKLEIGRKILIISLLFLVSFLYAIMIIWSSYQRIFLNDDHIQFPSNFGLTSEVIPYDNIKKIICKTKVVNIDDEGMIKNKSTPLKADKYVTEMYIISNGKRYYFYDTNPTFSQPSEYLTILDILNKKISNQWKNIYYEQISEQRE